MLDNMLYIYIGYNVYNADNVNSDLSDQRSFRQFIPSLCRTASLAFSFVLLCFFSQLNLNLEAWFLVIKGRKRKHAQGLPFVKALGSQMEHGWQPRPQGLLLVQNGGRRNPWPRLLKYSTNREVFYHVTHDEIVFSEVVSSVWRPCLLSCNLSETSCLSDEIPPIFEPLWQLWPGVSPTAVLNEEKALGTSLHGW